MNKVFDSTSNIANALQLVDDSTSQNEIVLKRLSDKVAIFKV